MEYLDLYDKNKKITGDIIVRTHDKANVPNNKYINIVLVFIKNSDNKFLLQLTSKEKDNVIATTGGHVKSGQSSTDAILSEIEEELGLKIDDNEVEYVGTYKRKFAFVDVYYLNKNVDISDITLQKEEVESVKWYTVDEINDLIISNKLRKGNIFAFKMILDYLNN